MTWKDIVFLVALAMIVLAFATAIQTRLDYQQNVMYNNAITMQE